MAARPQTPSMSVVVVGLVALGVVAGALTTLAGVGGGMLLVIALSLFVSPAVALASTAPALFLSNAHRWWLFRRRVDPSVIRPIVLGAVPGSVIGALLVVALPTWLLRGLMVAGVLLAVGKSLGWFSLRLSPRAVTLGAFGVGMVAATSGGAGLLVSPLLLAAGLTGEAYVASTAVAGVSMHAGRIVGYGIGGLFGPRVLMTASILAASLVLGNLVGRRVRAEIGTKHAARIELGTLVVCVALAVVGVAR